MTEIVDQPSPVPNDAQPVFRLVIQDLVKRAGDGKTKYGTYLQPFNGRNALVDLYQELLDGAQYTRQAMYELDRIVDAIREIRHHLTSENVYLTAHSIEQANDFNGAMQVLFDFAEMGVTNAKD